MSTTDRIDRMEQTVASLENRIAEFDGLDLLVADIRELVEALAEK